MKDLVAIDIGGTHTRFASASIDGAGEIRLGEPVTLATDAFADIESAWREFERRHGGPPLKAAAIAIAGPVSGDAVRMTNNSWEIHKGRLCERLGLERITVLNDFAAVAHTAACAGDCDFLSLAGPYLPLPGEGTVSVIGPGTGLGVAHFHRFAGGYHVQATEGSHIGFAPVDALDDAILARMRRRFSRVSLERVVSGPGIVDIHAALAGSGEPELDDRTIWRRGLDENDPLAAQAVQRFCLMLGRAAGDIALVHGASGVVVAGGLGLRIGKALAASRFAEGFCDKGRYAEMMSRVPVKLLTQAEPGLLGAALAFAAEHAP